MAELYAALAPYRAELMDEAATTGAPLVRPMFLEMPQVANAWSVDNQFMVGPDLVVAPVTDPGVSSVEVYLPAGEWVHAWSGVSYQLEQPATVEVSAPLGEPAALYRAGNGTLAAAFGR